MESNNRIVIFINDTLFTFFKKPKLYTIQKKNKYISFIRPICSISRELKKNPVVNSANDTIKINKSIDSTNNFNYLYVLKNDRIRYIEKVIQSEGYEQYESYKYTNYIKTKYNINKELSLLLNEYTKYVKPIQKTPKVINYIEFEGNYLDGKPFKSSLFNKKKVLYFFWHKKCFPCVISMPKIEELFKKYNNIEVLGVNTVEKASEVRKFTIKNNINFTNIVSKDTRIKEFPFFIIVDNKRIIYSSSGASDEQFNELDSIFTSMTKK
jgi:thiol-disulfide isomerase/thioredoxin